MLLNDDGFRAVRSEGGGVAVSTSALTMGFSRSGSLVMSAVPLAWPRDQYSVRSARFARPIRGIWDHGFVCREREFCFEYLLLVLYLLVPADLVV